MLTDPDRGIFSDRLWSFSPRGCQNHPGQKGKETGTDPTGEQTTQGQSWNRCQIFFFVDEHDREQDQHVHGTHINQNLGCCHEAGIEQEIKTCYRQEDAPKQKSGINDVAEQNNTESSQHNH